MNWFRLNTLEWNTRIGLNVTEEVWAWVQGHLPWLHIIFFQEVKDVQKLAQILGSEWEVRPGFRPQNMGTVTCVATRRHRFSATQFLRRPIISAKHKREVSFLAATDMHTGRRFKLGSMHVDPLGRGFLKASPLARRRHVKQVKEWADTIFASRFTDNQVIVIIGSDVNERLRDEDQVQKNKRLKSKTAMAQFYKAGVKSTAAVKHKLEKAGMLEIWFGGPGIRCSSRYEVEVPRKIRGAEHFDHPLLVATFVVKKKR